MYCTFGDQTIGAQTKNSETATIPYATGKKTCRIGKGLKKQKSDI